MKKVILALAIVAALAACSPRANQNRTLFSCITVTEHDAEVVSDHLTNQIVAQNEFLGC